MTPTDQALRRARNCQHRFAPPPAVPTAVLTAAPRGSFLDAGWGRETALQPNKET